jgi:hypothetical protein
MAEGVLKRRRDPHSSARAPFPLYCVRARAGPPSSPQVHPRGFPPDPPFVNERTSLSHLAENVPAEVVTNIGGVPLPLLLLRVGYAVTSGFYKESALRSGSPRRRSRTIACVMEIVSYKVYDDGEVRCTRGTLSASCPERNSPWAGVYRRRSPAGRRHSLWGLRHCTNSS